MRTLHAALSSLVPFLVLSFTPAGLLGPGPQDGEEREGQDDEEEVDRFPVDPFRAFSERESKRLEAELEGAWLLTSFKTPEDFLDPGDFTGFASFNDGYMSWIIHGREVVRTSLTRRYAYLAEANVYRYEVGPQLTLQLANMLGFEWDTQREEIYSSSDRQNFEFEVSIEDDVLRLWITNDFTYEFSRLRDTSFPEKARTQIQRRRGALPTTDREF
jgi:hypothetical protein